MITVTVKLCDRVRGGWGNYRDEEMSAERAGALLRQTLELQEIGRRTMPQRLDWTPLFFACPIGDTVLVSYGGTLCEIYAIEAATVD